MESRLANEPRRIDYEEILVKKMLHYVNVWFLPFRWGANTYRGCEHDCIYCNARYTHEYLALPTGEFAHKVIVKQNAATILDKEFSREKWQKKMTVNLATVTDPYQPAEGRFKITQATLRVFLKHQNSLLLTTKSDLVLRDLDLLKEISKTGFLNVVISLSSLNEDLRSKIEPRVPSVERRLKVIEELHEAGITVGVAAIPLLPLISDNEKDVNELIVTAAEKGAEYVIVDMLNLRGEARERFPWFLERFDPDLITKYQKLYQTDYCDKNYSKRIKSLANRTIKEHRVDNYDKMFPYRKKGKINLQSSL